MENQKRSIEVSQRVEFSCSYITPCDDSYELNSIHYRFEATACGLKSYESTGRVISFEAFKKLIQGVIPDKTFIYDATDLNQCVLAKDFKDCGIHCYVFTGEISTERLLEEISLMLMEALSVYPEIYLKETKLRENNNSYVSWKQEVK